MILPPIVFHNLLESESVGLRTKVNKSGSLDDIEQASIYCIERLTGELYVRTITVDIDHVFDDSIELAHNLAKKRILVAAVFMSHRVQMTPQIDSSGLLKMLVNQDGDYVLVYGAHINIEAMGMGFNAAYFPIRLEHKRYRAGSITRVFTDPSFVHSIGNPVTGFMHAYGELVEKYSLFPLAELS